MRAVPKLRAFSLIEVAIVVAILGIAASLAIPNLLPLVHRTQLEGATDGVANFVARARAEAMLSKRCVDVRVVGTVSLVAERLNSFDCEATIPGTPFIDNSASAFLVFDRYKPESPNVTLSFPTLPAAPGSGRLRIRPSGRVFSTDVLAGPPVLPNLGNDDAVLLLTHTKIAGARGTTRILVEQNGLICTIARGQPPPGTSPNFTCP